MKKLVTLIIILGAAVAGYYLIQSRGVAESLKTSATSKEDVSRPDPSNATFTFDDEPITLSAGRNEKAVVPGSVFVEETVLLDKFAYGDINADGREDTLLFLARSGVSAGTFIYLAAFISGPITYHGSEAIFIGDRVVPQALSVKQGIITVTYLDRGPGEALAAEPTISRSKQFVFRAGAFQEK